jgi:hypothetical protein
MDSESKNTNPMAAQPQPPPAPAPACYQPLMQSPPQQPQVLYGGQPQMNAGYVSVQQQQMPIAINIMGSGAATMNPSNECVLCLSVFACFCCEGVLGVLAIALALVARVFHPDPANAVKAATLNRYAFRIAITAITLGIALYVFIFIIYGTVIANMIAAVKEAGGRYSSSNSYQSRYN